MLCSRKHSKKENLDNFTTLSAVSWENTVPFVPPVENGNVIKVYDGDTITIASKLPLRTSLFRFSMRLNGIDTPEIKGKDDNEKSIAKKSP